MLEALQVLAAEAKVDLPETCALVAKVKAVKGHAREALQAEAQAALGRLMEVDADGWREILGVKHDNS